MEEAAKLSAETIWDENGNPSYLLFRIANDLVESIGWEPGLTKLVADFDPREDGWCECRLREARDEEEGSLLTAAEEGCILALQY